MPLKFIVIISTLLVIVGCAHKRPPAANAPVRTIETVFAPVHTIKVRDETNPVLLASTGAKHIREYLVIGLTHLGYDICSDCQADAVATVTVSEFSTKQDSKRDWLVTGAVRNVESSNSVWELTIVRNGEPIFQGGANEHQTMSIDQMAGQQVQDVLGDIPKRQ